MRMMIALTALLLTACGDDRPPAPTPEENRQLDEAEAMLNEAGSFPTPQSDGSPLTAAFCLKVDEQPNSRFDNTKTCLMMACEKGDEASCDLAATYNGNLKSD